MEIEPFWVTLRDGHRVATRAMGCGQSVSVSWGLPAPYEITIDSGPVTDQARAFTIRSSIGVRNWSKRTPSAAAVRPTHCPGCHLGSRPVGQRLRLVGHGLRPRQIRTALEPDGPVTVVTVFVRRFLCRDCGAAIQVVPAEVLPRARYSATAMARALGLVGFGERSFAEARQVVGDGQNRDWPALRRWHRSLGGLGPRSPFRAVGSARERAQRVTARLLAYTPPQDTHGDMGRRAEIGATWLCGAPWIPRSPSPTRRDQVGAVVVLLGRGDQPRRHRDSGHRPAGRQARARRRLQVQQALIEAVRQHRSAAPAASAPERASPSGSCTNPVTLCDGHRQTGSGRATTPMSINQAARTAINQPAR